MMGIDLKPLERGIDALVRMADALEDITASLKETKSFPVDTKVRGGRRNE